MDFLEKDFKALGVSVFRQDGFLELRGKNPRSAILCAHVDRHGLISLGNEEYVYAAQYLKEIKYGENNRLSQKELESIGKRFEDEPVYAYDPENGARLGQGVIEKFHPHLFKGDALFFIRDMGGIDLGVPVAYARNPVYENGYLKGQIDNAISLAVIYGLFQDGFEGTAILAKEEEIGKSWIHIAASLAMAAIETQSLLVLDTSPYMDVEPIETGRVILRNRDMSAIFNPALVNGLKQRCEMLELPFQVKDERLLAEGKSVEQLGSTELGRLIQESSGRWSGASVQIPTLMYHTSSETTTKEAIHNYYCFLRNLLIDDPLPMLSSGL